MSHFPVLVTKTHLKSVEEQLEPFYEQDDETDYFMEKQVDYPADKIEAEARRILSDEYVQTDRKLRETYQAYLDKGEYAQLLIDWDGGKVDENGDIYHISNPRAKWDWYRIGGRWSGCLRLKPGAAGKKGEHRAKQLDPDTPDLPDDTADIVKVKDIDWGKMEQPTAIFAVLHDGEWYERGEMGGWAVVSNEKSPEDWQAQFDKIIASLHPEDEITLVDAHI